MSEMPREIIKCKCCGETLCCKGCHYLFTRPVVADAESMARSFHETYERLAPSFGYETRKESAKPWADVPEQNKQLTIAVCKEIRADLAEKPALDIGWVCPHCNVAYSPKKNRCECQDGLKARMG